MLLLMLVLKNKGENKMVAELVLTLVLEMFTIQLQMTEKAYNDLQTIEVANPNDLQTIEVANPKTATEWFYINKEENKWLDAADLTSENLDYIVTE